jgi:hypothetical protein
MAYYDAMIAKWATLNPGTTAAKLAALNAATATGAAIPMVIPTYKIYNLIDPTEFAALTAANQQLVRDILGMGTTVPWWQARLFARLRYGRRAGCRS